MVSSSNLRVWTLRILFVALSLLIILRALLPLGPEAPTVPGPDLILCLVFAWVLRRPDVLGAVLIALVVLVSDFLFMRPPGLWTALVLIGSEVLRREAYRTKETSFLVEMGMVTGVMLALMLAQRIILAVLFVAQPPLGATLIHLAVTLAAYPLVVFFSIHVVGIRPMGKDDASVQGLRG